MKIKDRLAINFTLLSSGLLLIIMLSMYFAFAYFFRIDFYSHLRDRAKIAAQLYLEADEISSDSLNHVRERILEKLPGEVIRVYNEQNRATFIKDESQYWDNNIIEKVRRNHNISFREGLHQTAGIYYPDNQGNFVILASAVDTHGKARLIEIAQIMTVIFIAVNCMLFFIGRLFAQRSLLPLNRMAQDMKRISASHLHVRVNEGDGRDEISSLARSFNSLLQHLQNSFELQQTFVANASHELRTPLTSITGEIEVALNKTRSVQDYEELLRSVLTDTERLTETVASLMELAQTDMEYTRAQTDAISFDELLWELQAHWISHPLKIDIMRLPEEPQALLLQANKNLLKIAFNNIIANAFKFSSNKPVNCTVDADGQNIIVKITDQGIGIAESELVKIFTPFYRATNGRRFDGTGVGLYVAFKIIQLFNGRIDVQSVIGEGTTVIVDFMIMSK